MYMQRTLVHVCLFFVEGGTAVKIFIRTAHRLVVMTRGACHCFESALKSV